MASAGADISPWHAPPVRGALFFIALFCAQGCALAPAIKKRRRDHCFFGFHENGPSEKGR